MGEKIQETIRQRLHREYRERTGHEPARAAAVILNCVECMGGSRPDARRCDTTDCFMWPFGPAAKYAKAKAKGQVVVEDDLIDEAAVEGEVDVEEPEEGEAAEGEAVETEAGEVEDAPPAGDVGMDDPAKPKRKSPGKRGKLPPVGTVLRHLAKDGKTVLAEVTVTEKGIEWKGVFYTSMSKSALIVANDLGAKLIAVNGWDWWGASR